MKDGKIRTFAPNQLEAWSDEQLRQLLLTQMEADEVNIELVRDITAVLASREEENGDEIDVHSAYETFRKEYADTPALFPEASVGTKAAVKGSAGQRHLLPRRFVRLVIVAAVIMALFLGTTIIASASGLDLWGIITRWTADVFGISGESSISSSDHLDQTDVYYHLRNALAEHGVYQAVVPRYVPEGYIVSETKFYDTFEGDYFLFSLSNGDNRIILRYLILNTEQPTRYYMKDDVGPEVYSSSGIEHYIMTNEQEYVVSWTNDNILCDISGLLTYDDVILMIDSIYKGG